MRWPVAIEGAWDLYEVEARPGERVLDPAEEFRVFVEEVQPRLLRALVAARGIEEGKDAVAEALAYAWQHWDRVQAMANPAGYLYRVARSRARRRRSRLLFPEVSASMPDVEPGLPGALAQLSERQRTTVLLVHGWNGLKRKWPP